MRSASLLGALGFCLMAAPGEAQYFGQNRVQHRHLEFAVIQSEHFDVYYYRGERAAAIDGARMAERAYARLSRLLGHRYRGRRPLVLFASHSDFQQNNVTTIGETTGGVTEPYRHRALLPFTGSYTDFEHVLQHELVHQFQFDIFARGVVGAGIQRLVSVNPPLWFMEGMAEYLSLGPVGPQTAMWLRDAVREGTLPTIEELTVNPRLSPYRFGHALWSFIAGRWGDGVVSRLLHGTSVTGVESAVARTLKLSLEELTAAWHEDVNRTFLPESEAPTHAADGARPVLTRQRSTGTLHVSPSLSPDGSEIAYLSEGSSFWIDLYLADAGTGAVKRRLVKSAFSADFESLRFINSTGAWSPDGQYFAFAAKHGGTDDLVIFDMRRSRVHRRVKVPLHGLTTPSWAPDGSQLVFTGYDGGMSDLYVINFDGSGLRPLTRDPYADLHPVWSPDGRRIAFSTDRGPESDLATLKFAPLRIALYDLQTESIVELDGMEGQNINPQWAPDGTSIAFVSDRTGIPNVFLYELYPGAVHQLTNVFSGVAGITPLSPAISWASKADRLVFTYYQRGEFNVYAMDNPRARRADLLQASHNRGVHAKTASANDPTRAPASREPSGTGITTRRLASAPEPESGEAPSLEPSGVERVGLVPPPSLHALDSAGRQALSRLSVRSLLDSATLALPDSSAFTFKPYSAKLSPDYVLQPSIGYVRDNFGGGFFGGSAVSLSDMLGNRRLFVGGQVNGRIEEAMLSSVYANLSRRINWAVGVTQDPRFYFTGSSFGMGDRGETVFTTRLERFIVRQAFAQALRPFSRYRRMEFGIRGINVARDAVTFVQPFDPATGTILRTDRFAENLETTSFLQPTVALVFDNSVSVFVGPLMGRRSRFEYAPALGGWTYHQVLGDYRRYDHLGGFFTIATRVLFFGRFGRDSDVFPLFLGTPELVRGYTAGSFRRRECLTHTDGSYSPSAGPGTTYTGCGALDQLIGSRIAVGNAELRFPLMRNAALGPVRLPPVEGALFFDAGVAWNGASVLVLGRTTEQSAAMTRYRTPLASWGFSLRGNLLGYFILRADYAKPLSRSARKAYWTLSIGPTF